MYVAVKRCACVSADILPEEHRYLPSDVFRYGFLDIARVCGRVVFGQSQMEASSGADSEHPSSASGQRLLSAATGEYWTRLTRTDVTSAASNQSEALPRQVR